MKDKSKLLPQIAAEDIIELIKSNGLEPGDRLQNEYELAKLLNVGRSTIRRELSYMVPGFKVEKVVDTVGAGDGLAAGVISGILEGMSTEDSVKRGNAIGAMQVMNISDNEGLPKKRIICIYETNVRIGCQSLFPGPLR